MQNEFFLGEVIKILGVSRHLLSQWIKMGLVKPSRAAKGSGDRNIFSFEDICRARLFQILVNARLYRDRASEFAFPSEKDKTQNRISEFINAYFEHRELHGLEIPKFDSVYLIFSKRKEEGIDVRICSNQGQFANLYAEMRSVEIFHVISLYEVIESIDFETVLL